MKTLRQLCETSRRPRGLRLVESNDTINADCRLLTLHADATEDEKMRALEQFARRVVSIKKCDVLVRDLVTRAIKNSMHSRARRNQRRDQYVRDGDGDVTKSSRPAPNSAQQPLSWIRCKRSIR